ncbi:MAG: HIT family protein [Defluviitaleaceae bacterium]|nr:HIT family protein [Defluviitaleaceae bacterium]MCL2837327.1 HIT family protein [Defluviitaleaceae bacterium]
MSKNCIFCKIINGELPAYKIWENEYFIAMLDINPAAYGHVLIVPKAHFVNLHDITDEYAREFLPFAQKITRAVMDVSGAEGFNLVQNNGASAGQTVMHFHAHVVPRRIGDGLSLSWIPKSQSKEFMAEMTEKLVKKLNG